MIVATCSRIIYHKCVHLSPFIVEIQQAVNVLVNMRRAVTGVLNEHKVLQ